MALAQQPDANSPAARERVARRPEPPGWQRAVRVGVPTALAALAAGATGLLARRALR